MVCMTIDRAAQKLGMQKAQFIRSAIKYKVWLEVTYSSNTRFIRANKKLQPFVNSSDDTINIAGLKQPFYHEYPNSKIKYMPNFDHVYQPLEISVNNICIPRKEVNYIKRKEGRIRTLRRKITLSKVAQVLAVPATIATIGTAIYKLLFGK
jgi:hypothetical protein